MEAVETAAAAAVLLCIRKSHHTSSDSTAWTVIQGLEWGGGDLVQDSIIVGFPVLTMLMLLCAWCEALLLLMMMMVMMVWVFTDAHFSPRELDTDAEQVDANRHTNRIILRHNSSVCLYMEEVGYLCASLEDDAGRAVSFAVPCDANTVHSVSTSR